ncbi:cyclopropane-fatty-acyl-phospholipid synthase family protein [Patescibacteria group bacterium]|nr:cyclopropane-fatty-acyl-phospholipid synthase family protein [Patescibacteria group bacterium]
MVKRKKVSTILKPLFISIFGTDIPILIEFWDKSKLGNRQSDIKVFIKSPNFLNRVIYAPRDLGFGRAYVEEELDFQGDIIELLTIVNRLNPQLKINPKIILSTIKSLKQLKVSLKKLPNPEEEANVSGIFHSIKRDRQSIHHHYDIGNDFYRLFLSKTMTYSCARFRASKDTLDTAQQNKYDLICRKLDLRKGMKFLDVGCGWGGMIIYASQHYGVKSVGITISKEQFEYTNKLIRRLKLENLVEVRLQDYRELVNKEKYDAISSIGMFEHVGEKNLEKYFEVLYSILNDGGRLLNHAISRNTDQPIKKNSFLRKYIFPDGELLNLYSIVKGMEKSGFEVRDVESLREHYALTLRKWIQNLDRNWEKAEKIVGKRKARIWRLYLCGSVVSFERAESTLFQILGVKIGDDKKSNMDLTREKFI